MYKRQAIGETVITAKRYSELFNILLSAVTLGSRPQELDSVTVGAADRIRVSDCKVAFVIGADSGVFPLDPSTEGLLSGQRWCRARWSHPPAPPACP